MPNSAQHRAGSDGRIAVGGKAVYGASIGILMLEARFPRIEGDVGNAASFDFPVHYQVVKRASPDAVVRHGAAGLLDTFIEAAIDLRHRGVDGITTNCGFLSIFQKQLAGATGLPVLASNLMQLRMIDALLPEGKRAGIITISKDNLSAAHLRSAGVPNDTPIVGTRPGNEFSRVILDDEERLDIELARQDLLEAAGELTRNEDVGAILLECTNMCPFSSDIARLTGLPVFDMLGAISWFQKSLRPTAFPNRV